MVRKTLNIHHLGEQRYVGISESGHQILMDNSKLKIGISPSETLLSAAAGCTAADVVSIFQKKRKPLQNYSIEVIGEMDTESTPKRYSKIILRHKAKQNDITQEELLKAAKLSHEKYCSVAASLNAQIIVEAIVEKLEE